MAYFSREPGYGVILSVDGRGRVTLHLPDEHSAGAAPLKGSRLVDVPIGYELDDAPGFERFFLVTAPAPFSVASVMEAAHTLAASVRAPSAPLPLPLTFTQTSLRLDKRRKDQP
jgi:hypothetical protein